MDEDTLLLEVGFGEVLGLIGSLSLRCISCLAGEVNVAHPT